VFAKAHRLDEKKAGIYKEGVCIYGNLQGSSDILPLFGIALYSWGRNLMVPGGLVAITAEYSNSS